jgi:hypothetical protein
MGASAKDWFNIVGPALSSFVIWIHCSLSQKRTNTFPLGEKEEFFCEFGNLDEYPGLTFGDRRALLTAIIESYFPPS